MSPLKRSSLLPIAVALVLATGSAALADKAKSHVKSEKDAKAIAYNQSTAKAAEDVSGNVEHGLSKESWKKRATSMSGYVADQEVSVF